MPLFDQTFFSQLRALRLTSSRQAQGKLFGEARGLRTGRSGEFADHRRYVPGDDLRTVDWPAFWRLRKAYTKLSESHEERPVYLVMDASASMGFGDPSRWDYCRRLTAALAFVAVNRGDPVRALHFSEAPELLTPPVQSTRQFVHLCEKLESAVLCGTGDVSESLRTASRLCPGRGLLVVLSDFLDFTPIAPPLSALAGTRHEVILVHLASPWEVLPSLDGHWELEDLETHRAIPVTGDAGTLSEYRRSFLRHAEQLRRVSLRRGIRYLFVRTDTPEINAARKVLDLLTR